MDILNVDLNNIDSQTKIYLLANIKANGWKKQKNDR